MAYWLWNWVQLLTSQQQERAKIHAEINAANTGSIQPPLDESALLHELVAQFLAHDGYVETARAFAEEVATETGALRNGQAEPLKKSEVEEDLEAINRNRMSTVFPFVAFLSCFYFISFFFYLVQQSSDPTLTLTFIKGIRAAILDGDIDKALKHTKAYYANVLEDYPHIHFKLRCRKFLEMIRRSNEIFATATTTSKPRRSVSPGISDEHAVFDQEMELDDGEAWDADGMDTEQPEATAQFDELLTEAVQYGQRLRADYLSEENGADKNMLDDIFSLIAYPDPSRSMHGHYLDPAGRVTVAEELNSAILGKLETPSAIPCLTNAHIRSFSRKILFRST